MQRALFALCLSLPLATAALEINDANRAQLEQLNGLGVETTARILAEREKSGAFRDWADLQRRVKGLRGKRLEQLDQQGLTVAGQPLPRTENRK
ncbi:MAG: ComEA family DNA-binding protein [Betaproteobacteria bacterium]